MKLSIFEDAVKILRQFLSGFVWTTCLFQFVRLQIQLSSWYYRTETKRKLVLVHFEPIRTKPKSFVSFYIFAPASAQSSLIFPTFPFWLAVDNPKRSFQSYLILLKCLSRTGIIAHSQKFNIAVTFNILSRLDPRMNDYIFCYALTSVSLTV